MNATCLAACGLAALLGAVSTARAQGAPGTAGQAPPDQQGAVQDIIVTSEHRAESLQEVPLSVTALTGETLDEQHIENFAELAKLTPGFAAGENYGFIRNASMRGISNNQFGFADDPSIAQYVDSVYQGRGGTGSQVNAYYDVDRVEVIKGPQGTLFGRSSIAGAISTFVNQPRFDATTGDAELGIGEYRRLIARAAVNVPLTDDLAVRLAADSESVGGYVRNLNGGDDLEPLDVKAARAIVRYDPIAGLDLSLKSDIEERRQSGSIYQDAGLPDFVVSDSQRGDSDKSDFHIWDVVFHGKYQPLDWLSVTSDTSYRRVGNEYDEKYDASSTIIGGPYYQGSRDRLFQEDVIVNIDEGPLTATIGGDYFNESLDAFVSNFVNSGFAFTGLPSPGLIPNDYSLAFNESGVFSGSFHGYSAFADATYEVLDGLKLTGGVRYNYDKKSFTQDIYNPADLAINAGKPFAGAYYNWGYYTSTPITSVKDWHKTTFRWAVSYDFSRDVTAYASYNQGWKAGGIDSFKVVTPQPFPLFLGLDATAAGGRPNIYGPENSESYEVGVKGRFLDRRLSINLAGYNYVYRDLQVSVPQGGSSIITNVGRAFGRGVEAELRFVPNEDWDFFANTAYNNTEIRSFPQIPNQVGEPLNFAPVWNGAAGATYSTEAPFGPDGRVSAGADLTYRSKYRTDNDLLQQVRSYVLADLRLGWTDAAKRYEADFFIDNVFNTFTFSRYSAAQPFLFPVNERSVLGEPQIIGADLRYHFF